MFNKKTKHALRAACARIHALLRALSFLILLVAAAAHAARPDIVVAQAAALTGEGREMALDFVEGARTYFDRINTTGGIHGRHINYIVRDDASKAENTVELSKTFIGADHADVLFGYTNDAGITALIKLPEFRQAKIALFAPVTGSEIGGPGTPVFYTRASYADEGRRIIDQYRRYGFTRFAVLTSSATFSESAEAAVEAELKQANMGIAAKRSLPASGDLNDSDVRAIAATNPQVVIVLGDTVALAQFVKKFRPLNAGSAVVGLSVVNHTTLLEIAGPQNATGVVLTRIVPNPTKVIIPVVREHLTMMKKFRDEPASHATLEGHLAAKALVQALQAAGREPSREAVTAALRSPRRYDLDGIVLESAVSSNRFTAFADLSMVRKDGSLAN